MGRRRRGMLGNILLGRVTPRAGSSMYDEAFKDAEAAAVEGLRSAKNARTPEQTLMHASLALGRVQAYLATIGRPDLGDERGAKLKANLDALSAERDRGLYGINNYRERIDEWKTRYEKAGKALLDCKG